jgi:hypothetical protein
MTKIFPGAGATISFTPSPGDLPIWDETVRATGFIPWRVIDGIKLIELSLVKWPVNPATNILIIDPQDVKYL